MLMWMNDVRAVKCDELMMMMKCAIVCMKRYYNETKTVYRWLFSNTVFAKVAAGWF